MKCKICGAECSLFDKSKILKKYSVSYYQCKHCGFVQTEDPYWLDESYLSPITSTDLGILQRNISIANKLDYILRALFPTNDGNFLDYGGGYGLLVRMMRDKGFDFEWYDMYCKPIFSVGYEKSKKKYDAICSFEMLEHLVDPMKIFREIFSLSDNAIFSTLLLAQPSPKVKDWWYFSPDCGQHISFYTKNTMNEIANIFNLHYMHISGLHLFTKEKFKSSIKVKMCLKTPELVNNFFDKLLLPKRKSLLSDDYLKLTGKTL